MTLAASRSQLRPRSGTAKYSASRTGRNRKRNVGSVNSTARRVLKFQCSSRRGPAEGGPCNSIHEGGFFVGAPQAALPCVSCSNDRRGFPLEGQVDRHGAEEEQQTECCPSGAIDCRESRVLAGLQQELVRFPEQRVVRAQTMVAWCDLGRERLAGPQHDQLLPVERHE